MVLSHYGDVVDTRETEKGTLFKIIKTPCLDDYIAYVYRIVYEYEDGTEHIFRYESDNINHVKYTLNDLLDSFNEGFKG